MIRKNIVIPERFNCFFGEKYPIMMGAYRYTPNKEEYKAIEAKSIRIGSNSNWSVKENSPINKIKLISNSSVIFNFHGETCVHYVDSAFLSDAIISNSVLPNGEIKGPFRFLKSGRDDYFLAREGSSIYNAAIDRNRRNKLSKVKTKSLEVGTIYVTAAGTRAVYLGKVNSAQTHYNDYNKISKIHNAKLFCNLRNGYNLDFINFKTENFTASSFSFKNSHNFVETDGNIKLPDNIISIIRDAYRKAIKNKLAEEAGNLNYVNRYLRWDLNNLSPLINMHGLEEKDFVNFDVNKYLMIA